MISGYSLTDIVRLAIPRGDRFFDQFAGMRQRIEKAQRKMKTWPLYLGFSGLILAIFIVFSTKLVMPMKTMVSVGAGILSYIIAIFTIAPKEEWKIVVEIRCLHRLLSDSEALLFFALAYSLGSPDMDYFLGNHIERFDRQLAKNIVMLAEKIRERLAAISADIGRPQLEDQLHALMSEMREEIAVLYPSQPS